MNAIRRDESFDNLHSMYVDQWDWCSVINKEDRTVETLKDVVRKIYAAMKETQEEVCSILALGLSYISCVCDPESFIIGGGVSKAGAILTETVQRHYVDNVFGELKKTKFVLATLGNDAGIYGGAKLALGE